MILVDFECSFCAVIFEESVDSAIKFGKCPECGNIANRIYTMNSGHRADPAWLESAVEVLQGDGERPIESRSEFNDYLKKNNIVQRC